MTYISPFMLPDGRLCYAGSATLNLKLNNSVQEYSKSVLDAYLARLNSSVQKLNKSVL